MNISFYIIYIVIKNTRYDKLGIKYFAYLNIYILHYILYILIHSSIKFKFKYSQTKIELLDVLVYKDQNDMLQATIYRKQKDRQNYLDV